MISKLICKGTARMWVMFVAGGSGLGWKSQLNSRSLDKSKTPKWETHLSRSRKWEILCCNVLVKNNFLQQGHWITFDALEDQSMLQWQNSVTHFNIYDTEVIGFIGEPICVRTLSNHCSGPWRWISIQHGVDVTSCRWYSAPQPLTNDMRIVQCFVSS